MKKNIVLLCAVLTVALVFGGCGKDKSSLSNNPQSADESRDAKAAAQTFLTTLYAVGGPDIGTFKTANSSMASQASSVASQSGFTSQGAISIDSNPYETLFDRFKNMMPEKTYSTFINDRTFINKVSACSNGNETLKPGDIILTVKSTGKDSYNYIYTYNFAYDAQFTSTKLSDNTTKTGSESGIISVTKDTSQWLISSFKTTKSFNSY